MECAISDTEEISQVWIYMILGYIPTQSSNVIFGQVT